MCIFVMSSKEGKVMSKFQAFRNEQRKKLAESRKISSSNVGSKIDSGGLDKIIKSSRVSGILNLSDRSLETFPKSVWMMNQPQDIRKSFHMDKVDEDNWWDERDLNKLILASNLLRQIPSEIKLLDSLVILDLHNNRLEELPPEIGALINLSKLNLNHNSLSILPPEIKNLKQLVILNVNHNSLISLPEELESLELLDSLDLSFNSLNILPESFGFLSKIKSLDLSRNSIQKLPDSFSFFRNLRTMDLSYNKIESVGDFFENFQTLEVLYFKQNLLNDFPNLKNCSSLKELHIGNNKIISMETEKLSSSIHLTILDLKGNNIRNIPSDLHRFAELERIDFGENDLRDLPATLAKLPSLQSLIVDSNPIKTVRRDILSRGTVELLKYLRDKFEPKEFESESTKEDVSYVTESVRENIEITPFPDVYVMKTARSLALSGKNLTKLPENVVQDAVSAGVLSADLSKNSFEEIPLSLTPLLSKISEINLSYNKLSGDISRSLIEGISSLSYINLSVNKLDSFDFASSTLREINISYNRFRSIPSSLYDCLNLENLLISNNQIEEIDVEPLSKLTKLAVFDISNNNVASVPPKLGSLTHITHLQLEGNVFRVPRASVLSQGTPAIMEYLRGRIPSN